MGYYDLPASIDYIIENTGASKVTVIGHSQGTSQMWYALSKRQDFFAEKVNRFISMATCTIPETYPGVPIDYEGLVALFLRAEELGISNVQGNDASSIPLFEMLCLFTEDPIFCLANDALQLSGYDISSIAA